LTDSTQLDSANGYTLGNGVNSEEACRSWSGVMKAKCYTAAVIFVGFYRYSELAATVTNFLKLFSVPRSWFSHACCSSYFNMQ